jgi:glycosyltransferase involved in cell wall biosynthesis
VRGAITTTEPLAAWCVDQLSIPAQRVWHIPNFSLASDGGGQAVDLPGRAGARIVCVANLRPEKDHLTLVRAMAIVVRQHPAAHLLIVGPRSDSDYFEAIHREIAAHALTDHITLLGQRQDVNAILRACDIGVLSSVHEGLPLALIEYGLACLPAVATDVGACASVLDNGRVGIVVPPAAPGELAAALVSLLQSPTRRTELGEAFRQRVETTYGPGRIVDQVCSVYDMVSAQGTKEEGGMRSGPPRPCFRG